MAGPLSPRLALGCAQLGNLYRARSEEEATAILEEAWNAGIRHSTPRRTTVSACPSDGWAHSHACSMFPPLHDVADTSSPGWLASSSAPGEAWIHLCDQAMSRPRRGPGGQPIRTTPDIWAKIITEFATGQRFDTINLIPEQETSEQLRLFAAEVIPLARDAITAASPSSR